LSMNQRRSYYTAVVLTASFPGTECDVGAGRKKRLPELKGAQTAAYGAHLEGNQFLRLHRMTFGLWSDGQAEKRDDSGCELGEKSREPFDQPGRVGGAL
jgi:hypothetical protein